MGWVSSVCDGLKRAIRHVYKLDDFIFKGGVAAQWLLSQCKRYFVYSFMGATVEGDIIKIGFLITLSKCFIDDLLIFIVAVNINSPVTILRRTPFSLLAGQIPCLA